MNASSQGPRNFSESECIALADGIARRIHELRLDVPAMLLLEMHRPLCTLAHTAALALEPMATVLFGKKNTGAVVMLLSDPAHLAELAAAIERYAGAGARSCSEESGGEPARSASPAEL